MASFQIRPCPFCGKPKALGMPCPHCDDKPPSRDHGAIDYDAIKAQYGSAGQLESTLQFQRANIRMRLVGKRVIKP